MIFLCVDYWRGWAAGNVAWQMTWFLIHLHFARGLKEIYLWSERLSACGCNAHIHGKVYAFKNTSTSVCMATDSIHSWSAVLKLPAFVLLFVCDVTVAISLSFPLCPSFVCLDGPGIPSDQVHDPAQGRGGVSIAVLHQSCSVAAYRRFTSHTHSFLPSFRYLCFATIFFIIIIKMSLAQWSKNLDWYRGPLSFSTHKE